MASSETGADVVSTCVMSRGTSGSQRSRRWTLYPTHVVLRFLLNEPLRRRENRDSEQAAGYSHWFASGSGRPHRNNSGPTLVVRYLRQAHDTATEALLDQRGQQAGQLHPVRCLRQELVARLPPQASATLHCANPSDPPTPAGCGHAASREQQWRDC